MAGETRTDAKAAATVMIAGSAAFLVAAFMPVARVFAERDPGRKLAILQRSRLQWRGEQQLFAAGTVVMPVGVVMLARAWNDADAQAGHERAAGQKLALGAAVVMAAGAVPFLVHLEARHRNPAAFASGRLPTWPFYSYTWLNLTGMAALGAGLLMRARSTAYEAAPADPKWPGWLNVGGAAVFGTALAATGDLPPLLVYGVELATGVSVIMRLRRGAECSRTHE
jgi:hypothetical protein